MLREVKRSCLYAGSWYPADVSELRRDLADYMNSEDGPAPHKVRGLLVPHAGYVYSGAVAGKGYAAVSPPKTVILLGPAHRYPPHNICVWDDAAWETPLGELKINTSLRDCLYSLTRVAMPDSSAHIQEHSLELQLPFIKTLNPEAQILPIVVSTHDLNELTELSEAITESIKQTSSDEVLVVASSDMSHYIPAKKARELDMSVLEAMCRLDVGEMLSVIKKHSVSMCGAAAAVVMMQVSASLGADTGNIISYATSGDKTGDQTEVVGYASLAI